MSSHHSYDPIPGGLANDMDHDASKPPVAVPAPPPSVGVLAKRIARTEIDMSLLQTEIREKQKELAMLVRSQERSEQEFLRTADRDKTYVVTVDGVRKAVTANEGNEDAGSGAYVHVGSLEEVE